MWFQLGNSQWECSWPQQYINAMHICIKQFAMIGVRSSAPPIENQFLVSWFQNSAINEKERVDVWGNEYMKNKIKVFLPLKRCTCVHYVQTTKTLPNWTVCLFHTKVSLFEGLFFLLSIFLSLSLSDFIFQRENLSCSIWT